ncbi:hypothetical protein APHAL10511_007806 [Amanita phalloides]|nr:hypothetical protein APHAL10511_007806 [Amanita phalloides]
MTTELVSLNCLFSGDKEDQVFTVEIAKNKNVSILKQMIKEEETPRLDHVAATDLELWNVSFPIDRLASEEPPAKGPKLRPASKVSSLVALSEEHVHILIKAPGHVAAPDPTQLLSLNCFVLGDDLNELFTVKIGKDKNVSILRDLIKEEKKPVFDHVAASKLDLFQVSVPVDDNFDERLKNTHLEPLKFFTPLSQLFPHVRGDHIHIVVQGPAGDVIRAFDPMQLLSLNCIVLGDSQYQMFTVKIVKNTNVSILKDLIKEEETPRLDHIPASKLILSQVSLPGDDDLEESLKNLNLTPLKPFLPLSQVFPRVEADRLHVVVKVPGKPDMTHPAEKVHHQIIKDANAAAAPSSVSNSPAMFKSEQEKYPIYDGRLPNRNGPPIAIYHTAFAQLKDSLRDPNKVVDPQELQRVDDTAKLSLASTPIYKTEKERTSNVYPYICSLLGIQLHENVATTTDWKKKAESDGLVKQDLDDKTFSEKVAIVGHVEAKNELGVEGQCGVQNMLGLRKFLTNDKYNDIHNTTCCPCIMISITGPYIMFGGAIFADIFVAEAFTDPIYLGGTKEQIVTLSRIFAAVAHALDMLKEYYRCLKLNPGPPNMNRLFPQPTYTANGHPQEMPTILRQFNYEGREPDDYQRSLFEATYNDRPVLIKFCDAYHGNAHRIVADAGFAPQLFFCERLQGGVMMVIMELVDGRDAFYHFSNKTIPSDLLDNMKNAITILHNANLVFGDMRQPNILIKEENDTLRALLIDFELVGEAGQARYPPFLNDSGDIAWAEGVRPHGLMRKQHDVDMINSLNHSIKVMT